MVQMPLVIFLSEMLLFVCNLRVVLSQHLPSVVSARGASTASNFGVGDSWIVSTSHLLDLCDHSTTLSSFEALGHVTDH